MASNATLCSNWRLYVIVDRATVGARDLAEVAAAAIRGGADVIQLRDKQAPVDAVRREAKRLLLLTRAAGVPLIINDYVEVARLVGADGVHLGQEDCSIADARKVLEPMQLIGKSTHSLDQALAAQRDGADYIGCGPVFPTSTKPDYPSVGLELVKRVTAAVSVPVICIGGIDRDNFKQVVQAGGTCVAVVRAVAGAADPEWAAKELKQLLAQFVRRHTSPAI